MILTQKEKVYNADFPRRAEEILYLQRERLKGLSLPGIGKASIFNGLEIKTEFPDHDFPSYRWVWIEADEKLTDAIQKHNAENPEYWID